MDEINFCVQANILKFSSFDTNRKKNYTLKFFAALALIDSCLKVWYFL
jgi:hypothetical protein